VRKLIGWMVVLAVLWCGYWAVGSFAVQSAANRALADGLQAGRISGAPQVETGGFPLAFALSLRDLDAGDPVRGLRWQSPALHLRAPMWRPWHVKADLEGTQRIALPDQDVTLVARLAQASATARPIRELTLAQATVVLDQPDVQSSQGWRIGAEKLQLQAELLPAPEAAHTYQLLLGSTGLRPDPALVAVAGLGPAIEVVDISAQVTLTAALDLARPQPSPEVAKLVLSELHVIWGDIRITAMGSVNADAQGLAEGRIDIRIVGWRALVAAAVGAGALSADMAPTVEGLLGAMALQSGDPDVLALPLTFAAGRGNLGPLPLGPAPRLRATGLN
jgi:hypothetical protein